MSKKIVAFGFKNHESSDDKKIIEQVDNQTTDDSSNLNLENLVVNKNIVKKTFSFNSFDVKQNLINPPILIKDELKNENLNELPKEKIKGFTLDSILKSEEFINNKDNQQEKSPIFDGDKNKNNDLNEKEIKKLKFLALKEKVRDIKITEIAKLIGAKNGEDKIRSKWKMPWGHNVTISGQKWFNHNSEFRDHQGGNNAISFAKYLMAAEYNYNLDDKVEAFKAEARGIYWLADAFEVSDIDINDLKASKEDLEEKVKAIYSPPIVLAHYKEKVFNYLTNERALPKWIINEHFEKNDIYASIPNLFLNKVVFTDQKKTNVPRDLNNLSDNEIYCIFKSGGDKEGSAECRVIGKDPIGFEKGFNPGSYKKSVNFMTIEEEILSERIIALCEASIDALSYRAMKPGRTAVSIGGVDNLEFTLKLSLEILEHPTYKLCFAFDNDNAGNNFYNTILEQISNIKNPDAKEEEKKQYIQELIDSGKIIKDTPVNAKDWNEMLKNNPSLAFDMDDYREKNPLKKKTKQKTSKMIESLTNEIENINNLKPIAFAKVINNDISQMIKNKM